MKKLIAVAMALLMLAAFAGCKKEADKPITGAQTAGGQKLPEGHPDTSNPMGAGLGTGTGAGGGDFVTQVSKTEVPAIVKGKWSSVILTIEDKKANKFNDVTVRLNSEYKVPNTNLKVKVGDFLPDFRMADTVITSTSNEPNNPAVHVTVFEGQNEAFKGWLYAKFPAIHPFQHEAVGIILKEGIRAK